MTVDTTINDVHCHFFSPHFFAELARQRGRTPEQSPAELCRELQWEAPGAPDALGDRWVAELDAHGVTRVALMASVPGDEASIAEAAAHHPTRIIGFFMVDPSAPDAQERVSRGVTEMGLRGICLFPAMHHVGLDDERVTHLVEIVAAQPGVAVFVHCGLLTVGVRAKLGLPSRFDLRLGNPLDVSRLALTFPSVPFIIPHFGAGLFREALMAADAAPNILLDTSSSNSWIKFNPGLTLRDVFARALDCAGSKRLLFGSDSSFFPRGWNAAVFEAQQAIFTDLGVTDADRQQVFGGNFSRILDVQ